MRSRQTITRYGFMNACFIILLISLASVMPAETVRKREFESWSSISLAYKPNKLWTFELEGELRHKENWTLVDQYFAQFNLAYKLSDHVRIGGGIRYIRNNDTTGKIQGYENHTRFHLDLSVRHKLASFAFKHRIRYQNRSEIGNDDAEAKTMLRFKTGFTYKIRNWKLDPIISVEIFKPLGSETVQSWEKYWLTVGTQYKIKGFGKIGIFYRLEQSLDSVIKTKANILLFKYSYTIK